METLLRDLPGLFVYLVDILITVSTLAEHLANLEGVLKRLSEAGLRLNKEKCAFFLEQIEYLGHMIDAQGVHPTGEKIKAIKNAPQPKNVTELRSFFGQPQLLQPFLAHLLSKNGTLIQFTAKDDQLVLG